MTEQVERDGYDQFWDVVESAPVHQGHIAQPIDALRSAWLVRDLTEDDFRAARAAIAALTVTPQEAAKVLLGYAAGIKPAVEAYDDQTFSSLQDFGAFTFALECIAQEDSHE